MKRREAIAALPLIAASGALAQAAPPPPPVATMTATDELKALLEKQAKQWSAGDLDGFCAHYAEDCLFEGSRENSFRSQDTSAARTIHMPNPIHWRV